MSTLEGSALSCAEVLSRIEDIRPALTEAIPRIETARCLPSDVVDALRGTGAFSMVMPRARGGPELDPIEQFHVVEALARIDASIGWCVMIGSDSGYYSAFVDPDVAIELWPSLDLVTAGWIAPGGQGEVTDGGYRLSGRWSFGSGCQHADVFVGGFLVSDAGVPRFGPDGRPELRVAVFDPSAVEIHDTWHTTGLAGSGSTDYSVTDLMVPFEHTFSLLGDAVATRRSEPPYAYPGTARRRPPNDTARTGSTPDVRPAQPRVSHSSPQPGLSAEASTHAGSSSPHARVLRSDPNSAAAALR